MPKGVLLGKETARKTVRKAVDKQPQLKHISSIPTKHLPRSGSLRVKFIAPVDSMASDGEAIVWNVDGETEEMIVGIQNLWSTSFPTDTDHMCSIDFIAGIPTCGIEDNC